MPAQYSAPSWGGDIYTDLELPSGGTIQAKRIDLAAIVGADMVDVFDGLSATTEEKVIGPAQGKRPADRKPKKPTRAEREADQQNAFKDMLKSGEMGLIVTLMARMLPQIVIQPKVVCHLVKKDDKWVEMEPTDRQEGTIYTDTIPLADQMHILEFGMKGMDMGGLQQFRQQPEPAVEHVAAEPVYQDPPV